MLNYMNITKKGVMRTMPLNKNLNEAVYANGTDGVTFIGSSEIQDLYQITAHEGLAHFVDLDNQQGGNP